MLQKTEILNNPTTSHYITQMAEKPSLKQDQYTFQVTRSIQFEIDVR
jgi:hypothetical protein